MLYAFAPVVLPSLRTAVHTVAPVLAVLVAAGLAALALARRTPPPPTAHRLVALDGLRGYLALAVFVHHAVLWRGYLRVGSWTQPEPDVPLYAHLGQGSVAVFFMMTGFLFAAKLRTARTRPIDWKQLYVGRVLRIYPLYAVAMIAVLIAVAAMSGFERQVPAATLARNVLAWARFARPAINGVEDAWLVTAGVTWSLQYEWLFYAALPLAAPLFGVVPPARWLLAGALGTVAWAYGLRDIDPLHLGAFGAGVLASVLTARARVRAMLGGPGGALLAVGAVATAVAAFNDAHHWPVLLLLGSAFTVVASGNTLFGVLRWAPSRLLGEASYSIYLLHGILLFAVLRGLVGSAAAGAMPDAAYWTLITALAPVLVVAAAATYRFVERPALRATPHVQRWLEARRSNADGRAGDEDARGTGAQERTPENRPERLAA